MVKYQDGALDSTFAALADPTRRAILARLGESKTLSISDLAHPFPVSLPAVMKHLDVLANAGLIARSKSGRTVACRLTAAPLESAMTWLTRYQDFWTERLDRLAAFLEENPCSPKPPNPALPFSQASPSGVVSMRRRRKSTQPGPTRRK